MSNFIDPERACQQVLTAISHSGPPTDLDAVGSLWTTLNVHEEDLDQEGYLLCFGSLGADILIRRDDPPSRKRFTLAHELGHWTLANLEKGNVLFGEGNKKTLSLQPHHKRRTPEEAWCNKFAGCLLMPAGDLRSFLNDVNLSNLPHSISRGHAIFGVSQEAFISRICELTPICVFEVVSTAENLKIRRKFLSNAASERPVSQAVEALFGHYHKNNDLPVGPVKSHNHEVETILTRRSRYGQSWLVTVTPLAESEAG